MAVLIGCCLRSGAVNGWGKMRGRKKLGMELGECRSAMDDLQKRSNNWQLWGPSGAGVAVRNAGTFFQAIQERRSNASASTIPVKRNSKRGRRTCFG